MTLNDKIVKLICLSGRQLITIKTESESKMRKTGNPYLGTIKKCEQKVEINYPYSDAVSVELGEDFTAGPRSWGIRIPQSPVVIHKGNFYLTTLPVEVFEETYWFEGQEIPVDVLEPFLSTRHDIVRVKDFKIEHIKSVVTVDGEYL